MTDNVTFDEIQVQRMFGHEAAEDEDIVKAQGSALDIGHRRERCSVIESTVKAQGSALDIGHRRERCSVIKIHRITCLKFKSNQYPG